MTAARAERGPAPAPAPRVAVVVDAPDQDPAFTGGLAGLDVVVLSVAEAERQLPTDAEAVYLAGADQDCARRLQAGLSAEWAIPCLTREEMTAVALAGQLLALLIQTGTQPGAARVVIVEPTAIPSLRPVLVAAGLGEIISWHGADAQSFPLRRIARGADAVFDPFGGSSFLLEPNAGRGRPALITVDDPAQPLLALPGLLWALWQTPAARPDARTFHACAHALAVCTALGRRLPDPFDPDLTPMVIRLAAHALATHEETR
ncbi:hypothetical protein [Kutzneria sp. CA-103260]|uniref:hypothetical protein n=1 Tax=Kutzneria sp. CA-103260 TaxID=2802641 RepID=UPI001BA6F772|nr:hypothetical protein [Kutzneria sp. CA-103260]QUQ64240.1 hypothetical protein JJ691_19600 [Kutzneria sp. CA-103260]